MIEKKECAENAVIIGLGSVTMATSEDEESN